MASFGSIIEEMKRGGAGTRASWPAMAEMGIRIILPDGVATMPYICIYGAGFLWPWFPSTEDILAEDWSPIKKSKIIIPKGAN